jgi:hypothetical protein
MQPFRLPVNFKWRERGCDCVRGYCESFIKGQKAVGVVYTGIINLINDVCVLKMNVDPSALMKSKLVGLIHSQRWILLHSQSIPMVEHLLKMNQIYGMIQHQSFIRILP